MCILFVLLTLVVKVLVWFCWYYYFI